MGVARELGVEWKMSRERSEEEGIGEGGEEGEGESVIADGGLVAGVAGDGGVLVVGSQTTA